ncbi:MAG: hypothetical protein LBJ14_01785 [Desulfarculales bacterium]|jgi:pyruvate carboxylase subunit B|nr:hypothetical protein [Desulfarculales bacterium]
MKKINFMVTAFRDGFQSVYGGRVFMKDYLPALEAVRDAGIMHIESGGGAMFQSPFFYTGENSFANMELFRKTMGADANLQTLARGVNVVGLDSQSSDIIALHARLFKKYGVSTIRNFDALNDVNNLIYSGKCIKEAGLRHEVAITMMSLAPGWDKDNKVHNPEFYASVLRGIINAGIDFDSVCFKDASGTSTPYTVYKTVGLARKILAPEVNITFHTHDTAGTSVACYLAAVRAGANTVDLSLSPVSGGTGSPDVITMWHTLRGSDFSLDVDIEKVIKAEEVFKECMKDYFLPPEATSVDPRIPFAPMPGGALTANTQMMRDAGILDRYEEVFKNMGECVRRGGFGTSVTPVSQFYFQQAFNNTMIGPWKRFAEGYGKMVLGYFGKTPMPPDKEIVKMAGEQLGLPPTARPVLELNDADPKKGRQAAEAGLRAARLPVTDENVFICAACGEKGIMFLLGQSAVSVRKKSDSETASAETGPASAQTLEVTLDGSKFKVRLENGAAFVNGKSYKVTVRPEAAGAALQAPAPAPAQAALAAPAAPPAPRPEAAPAPRQEADAENDVRYVTSPFPGMVFRTLTKSGEKVEEGQVVFILEAMKMESEIITRKSGVITVRAQQGDQVQTGQILAEIS